MTTKKEILTLAAKHREQEVLNYQINIDNYQLALQEISVNYPGREDLVPFVAQLKDLLSSSLLEQTKEKILLTVIKRQLVELESENAG